MNEFKLDNELVEPEIPELGHAAVVPWDSQYFGFNVGTYEPADLAGLPALSAVLEDRLRRWMRRHDVELLACTVPSGSNSWVSWLCNAGFAFVDLSLLAFARRLTVLPPARIPIRVAVDADEAALVRIAGKAFTFGRYHADARFPRALADDRYRHWMRNAMSARSEREFVLVSGAPGTPTGFVHAVIRDKVADLRLAAVDPTQNVGLLGTSLFTSALHSLVDYGATRAQARISAANTSILNLYSSLGFALVKPESIFHLHARAGTHLADMENRTS